MGSGLLRRLNENVFVTTMVLSLLVGATLPNQAESKSAPSGLIERIEALEAALGNMEDDMRRFHRGSAAVIEFDSGGGSSIAFDSIDVILKFCTEEEFLVSFNCPDDSSPKLSVTLYNGDRGIVATFSSTDDDPDFGIIADMLTNGESDFVVFSRRTGAGGGSNSALESGYFRDFLPPDGIDLTGYSIASITLFIDQMIISGSAFTEYSVKGRYFYELAD